MVRTMGTPSSPWSHVMVSGPANSLASMTAARNVHVPAAEAQIPSPGVTSTASSGVFTTKVAPDARPGTTRRKAHMAGPEVIAGEPGGAEQERRRDDRDIGSSSGRRDRPPEG